MRNYTHKPARSPQQKNRQDSVATNQSDQTLSDSMNLQLNRPMSPQTVVQLQRIIGNQAVQRLLKSRQQETATPQKIQRAPLSAAEKAKNLHSSRFAGNSRLEEVYDNSPPMKRGEKGEPVKLVQQALVDAGFALPVTTENEGSPDGKFGQETRQTVIAFQEKQGFSGKEVDGVVGRQTLGRLDAIFGSELDAQSDEAKAEEAVGNRIVNLVNESNAGEHSSPDQYNTGIHYSFNYRSAYEESENKAGWEVPWSDDLEDGYADPNYWERYGFMRWRLRPGVSASEGLKAWLEGPTVAECFTTLIAVQTDAVREQLGNERFDELFGSESKAIDEGDRLNIGFPPLSSLTVGQFLKDTEAAENNDEGEPGNRPVKQGQWYYFTNHPRYLLKHPGGAFQGENAIYMGTNAAGEQIWSGLGISNVTEDEMLNEMVGAYNNERDNDDYRELVKHEATTPIDIPEGTTDYKALYESNKDKIKPIYTDSKYDAGNEQISVEDILTEPPSTIDGKIRKGGFKVSTGTEVDIAKVLEAKGK